MIFLAFFFFPIAVYFLILGALNRRAHPALVRGSWDCLGLLLASSGLLLFGGPALITAAYHAEVRDFLLGKPPKLDFGDLFERWWLIWLGYYLVVLCGSGLLLWWRNGLTAVYNVDPPVLDDILAQILDRIGLEWTRMGNRVFIGFRGTANRLSAPRIERISSPPSEQITAVDPPRRMETLRTVQARPEPSAVLDIEPFFATRHVTLNWKGAAPPLRAQIEAELARDLALVAAPENPAGVWFMVVASILFFAIFLSVAVMLILEIIARRGG